jgi:hypothetical protein|tara:strand:- start:1 stop:237 length:237 start_codon:yes stop_codon:yes gene_type:complete
MAFNKYAVVKLDPVESNSTGGIVEELAYMIDGVARTDSEMTQHWVNKYDEYKLVPIEEDDPVKVGWIYTDKTHEFVAP